MWVRVRVSVRVRLREGRVTRLLKKGFRYANDFIVHFMNGRPRGAVTVSVVQCLHDVSALFCLP